MKKQKKDSRCFYLIARNNRWKWMVGATAAATTGVTSSQAGLVTINFTNNYISGGGGDHLNADLTGDGHPDITLAGRAYYYAKFSISTLTFNINDAQVYINGIRAGGFYNGDTNFRGGTLGSKYKSTSFTGSIPVFFKDLHINGGSPTEGSLEVTVGPFDGTFAGVRLDSLTFTSNTPGQTLARGSGTTVPDQGSTLALLAMGAGGVLALRRWRAGQGQVLTVLNL
jgi:hypothetical protein